MSDHKVAILMGSASDLPVMEAAGDVLNDLGIGWRMAVRSAHRTPEETVAYVRKAEEEGVKVLICGAGMAAHLAGVVAAESLLPVIGVPINASLDGMDSLLATVQMPPGIPVATVASVTAPTASAERSPMMSVVPSAISGVNGLYCPPKKFGTMGCDS